MSDTIFANDLQGDPFQPEMTEIGWTIEDAFRNRYGAAVRTGLYLQDRASLASAAGSGVASELASDESFMSSVASMAGFDSIAVSSLTAFVSSATPVISNNTVSAFAASVGVTSLAAENFAIAESFGVVNNSLAATSSLLSAVSSASSVSSSQNAMNSTVVAGSIVSLQAAVLQASTTAQFQYIGGDPMSNASLAAFITSTNSNVAGVSSGVITASSIATAGSTAASSALSSNAVNSSAIASIVAQSNNNSMTTSLVVGALSTANATFTMNITSLTSANSSLASSTSAFNSTTSSTDSIQNLSLVSLSNVISGLSAGAGIASFATITGSPYSNALLSSAFVSAVSNAESFTTVSVNSLSAATSSQWSSNAVAMTTMSTAVSSMSTAMMTPVQFSAIAGVPQSNTALSSALSSAVSAAESYTNVSIASHTTLITSLSTNATSMSTAILSEANQVASMNAAMPSGWAQYGAITSGATHTLSTSCTATLPNTVSWYAPMSQNSGVVAPTTFSGIMANNMIITGSACAAGFYSWPFVVTLATPTYGASYASNPLPAKSYRNMNTMFQGPLMNNTFANYYGSYKIVPGGTGTAAPTTETWFIYLNVTTAIPVNTSLMLDAAGISF